MSIVAARAALEPGIYSIRNVTNGKVYIGSAARLEKRKRLSISHIGNTSRVGTHHSAETRMKLSVAAKNRRAA